MLYANRLAVTLLVLGTTSLVASAQPPSDETSTHSPASVAADHKVQPYKRRNVAPTPPPESSQDDKTAGFRNPGGVGRHLEYYPAGNRWQQGKNPVRVARFDQGGGAPDHAKQMAAQKVGIQRTNSIMSSIDRYAKPSFGVGSFGGFY